MEVVLPKMQFGKSKYGTMDEPGRCIDLTFFSVRRDKSKNKRKKSDFAF